MASSNHAREDIRNCRPTIKGIFKAFMKFEMVT